MLCAHCSAWHELEAMVQVPLGTPGGPTCHALFACALTSPCTSRWRTSPSPACPPGPCKCTSPWCRRGHHSKGRTSSRDREPARPSASRSPPWPSASWPPWRRSRVVEAQRPCLYDCVLFLIGSTAYSGRCMIHRKKFI